jgi:hypothetical protein
MFTLSFIRLTTSDWYWAALALLIALAGIVLYYRRTVPPLRRRVKIPLAALRVIAVIALFLTLADALWASIHRDRRLHDLLVLIDGSASMEHQDDRDDPRFERAQRYFDRWIEGDLAGRARIERFFFHDGLIDAEAPPESLGASTALGTALADVATLAQERDPRAVVVLSDGATNRGIEPMDAINRLNVPVVTVGFGEVVGAQARVVEAEAPEVVLTGQPFELSAVLQSGETDESVTLRLSSAGRTVEQQTASLQAGGTRTPMTFNCVIDTPGVQGYRLDVLGADGRSIPTAGKTVFVRALKGRLKVILIGGALDWEYSFLARWLRRQPRIDLTSHCDVSPPIGDPAPSSSDWANTDVAIFVHPTGSQLNSFWAPHTRQFAQPGHGALFMLDDRFEGAALQSPPYPFEFLRKPVVSAEGEYSLQPLPTRQNHPLVRFDPASNWTQTLEAWSQRPPWVQVNCFSDLPSDADVLVEARHQLSSIRCPAVWTRTSRGGKTLVLSGGPIWRWATDRAREGLDPVEYDAFFKNAIRWLSLRDDTDRLAVRTDRQIYYVGEPILLDAAVFDEVYRFLDRAEVTARIWPDTTGADTMQVFLPPGAGNRFVGHISHLAPGTYRYDGTALVDSVQMPLAGDIFRVEPYGLEQQYLSLNEKVLRGIATSSGGRYYSENEAPAFLDSLDWAASVEDKLIEIPLWNQTTLLAIFVVALTAEWFIRRRKQLL